MPGKHLSIAEYNRLKKIEEAYNEMKEEKALEPFVKDFAHVLATFAAYTPMDKWPKEFKLCLEATKGKFPMLYWLYVVRHKRVNG